MNEETELLYREIRRCRVCESKLSAGVNPVLTMDDCSKILVIGQAPGIKVHLSGIPWDDQSGKELRNWLGVTDEIFYDSKNFAIIPMGFCYPGKGKNGDLPPCIACAPLWHEQIGRASCRERMAISGGAGVAERSDQERKSRQTRAIHSHQR